MKEENKELETKTNQNTQSQVSNSVEIPPIQTTTPTESTEILDMESKHDSGNNNVINNNTPSSNSQSSNIINKSNSNSGIMNEETVKNNTTTSNTENNSSSANDISTEFVEKKTKNKKMLIIILFILLILLILLGYKLYLGDSVVLFKTALNRGYNEISETLDELEENSEVYSHKESVLIDGNFKLESNLEELATYAEHEYKFNLGMDAKNEKMSLYLGMLKNEQTVVDGLFYFVQNMLYVKADKIYPQVLSSDMGENIFEEIYSEEQEETYDYDDIDQIVKKLTIYIGNSFEKEKFVKEDATLQVAGEEINVVKHVYVINKDSAYNIMTSILNDIKEDEEFIRLLAKISSTNEDELKESINNMSIEPDDYESLDADPVNISIYTTGFFPKFLGIGMSSEVVNMTYTTTNEQSEFNYVVSDTTLNIITKDKTTTGIMKDDGEEILNFTIKSDEQNNKLKNTIEFEVTTLTLNGTLSTESNKVNDKKIDSTLNVDINMGSGTEKSTFSAELTYNMEIGATITEVNTEGAVDINALTDAELAQLATNLQNAFVGTPLETLFTQTEDTYDDYSNMYRLEDFTNLLNPFNINNEQ